MPSIDEFRNAVDETALLKDHPLTFLHLEQLLLDLQDGNIVPDISGLDPSVPVGKYLIEFLIQQYVNGVVEANEFSLDDIFNTLEYLTPSSFEKNQSIELSADLNGALLDYLYGNPSVSSPVDFTILFDEEPKLPIDIGTYMALTAKPPKKPKKPKASKSLKIKKPKESIPDNMYSIMELLFAKNL